ncbi:MAG: molybdenum ABC transporter ATP-binding protein [Candidatus Krumholzibacteriota bacterium]
MSLQLKCRLERPDGAKGQNGFRLDVDLSLPGRGITAVVGPSGCGKTTLLRCVAGLEPRTAGHVLIGDKTWQDDRHFLPPHRRRAGYVFQDGALFPHLDVRGNLAYGRKRSSGKSGEIEEISTLLRLASLLDRDVSGLSGGERQRVALGRALLAGPELLLLDEPLAALDRENRLAIYPYFERIAAETGLPFLYVTHAQDEAARLADHLVLMEDGRARHHGPLAELLTSPDPGLAHGDHAGCVVFARIVGVDDEYHLARLEFPGGTLLVADPGIPEGRKIRVRIHARDVSLALEPAEGSSILNILPARVLELIPDGPSRVLVRLQVGRTIMLAAVTQRSAAALKLRPNQELFAQVKSVALL